MQEYFLTKPIGKLKENFIEKYLFCKNVTYI